MKRTIIFLSCFLLFFAVKAQKKEDKYHMRAWNVVMPSAIADSVAVDTVQLNFQNANPVDLLSIANAYTANLGSPIQSKIYLSRPSNSAFLFADAYSPYITTPENILYYNTQRPISNLFYNGGLGGDYKEENNIDFLFTANINKRLNLGTTLKYIISDGKYANQSATRFTGTLFFSYSGKYYEAAGAVMLNNIRSYESGGLVNPQDVGGFVEPSALPVRLTKGSTDAYSVYGYNAFVYNHSYSLGFHRDIVNEKDSTTDEIFVPVTRFSHTLQLSDSRKKYLERRPDSVFYDKKPYFSDEYTRDTVAFQEISNTFSVSIEEKFNKWLKFGLLAFVKYDIQKYSSIEKYALLADSGAMQNTFWHRTKIGGVLSKREGSHLKYKLKAELDVLGAGLADFNLEAQIDTYFKLWKDSLVIQANGFSRAETPSFFLQNYRSNFFQWQNDFGKTLKTQIGATLSVPKRKFSLNGVLQNLGSYVYFDSLGMPQQHKEQIQLLLGDLRQDFRLGKIHLDNQLVYQLSSQQDILALPTLALYHNLYYLDTWFDVFRIQLGVDLRYHTAYYAPAYMPATGRFHSQKEVKVGDYPLINLYVNCELKQVRFFVKAYHINNLFMKGSYLSMPNYPLNPMEFKMGVSWFFDN